MIFHGQFAFVCTKQCIEVLAPAIDGQLCCAATINQTTLARTAYALRRGASYLLCGVKPGADITRFNPKLVPLVESLATIDRNPRVLHFSIYCPMPDSITSLRGVRTHSCFFGGDSAKRITPATAALVHIFSYGFEDLPDVRLDGPIAWTPAFTTGSVVNLHVFAEGNPAAPAAPADHAKAAFARAVRLFPGLSLKLNDHEFWAAPAAATARGITEADQRNLFELGVAAGAQLAPVPAMGYRHCISLVVDNT
jgi:hypothetical protein